MGKAIYRKWKEYTNENKVQELDDYLQELLTQAVGQTFALEMMMKQSGWFLYKNDGRCSLSVWNPNFK